MLTLIVPGLIWTRQALADLTFDLPLPAFTTLLGRGRLRHLPPADTTAHLAAAGGLTKPLPAAALRRLALRGESDDDTWLEVAFIMRHATAIHPETRGARLGCEFVNLGQAERDLQLYINQTQKRQLALAARKV